MQGADRQFISLDQGLQIDSTVMLLGSSLAIALVAIMEVEKSMVITMNRNLISVCTFYKVRSQ